ncbi:MAG: Holliday junction branch migration DNA helicase RuvB [Patescibacteria group bacterium]
MTKEKIDTKKINELLEADNTLRPKKFTDFVGQKKILNNLLVMIEAAKKREEHLDHVLFYGPPGIGKTTVAHIIANEIGSNLKITSGPAITRAGDLASILTNLEENDVLFIDEIHRLTKNVEETIYPAMEDFAIDIIIGKGPSARTVRLDLPKFTLVGATTKIGNISNPLRDRFGAVFRLDYYTDDELSKILKRSAKIMMLELDQALAMQIAKRARGTPRIANRILKRMRDYSEVHQKDLNKSFVDEILSFLGIDEFGLESEDIKYLRVLNEKFKNGPAGLSTLSAALSEDEHTVEEVIEPYLIKLGLVRKTTTGRTLTDFAVNMLNKKSV